MQGRGGKLDGGDLLRELQAARDEPAHAVAVLWTWLERQTTELVARREKPPAIYKAGIRVEFKGITDEVLAWVVEDPLRNGAELLVRIAHTWGDGRAALFEFTKGIEGEEVLVAWRVSELVRRMGGDEFPPTIFEHPSLTTLAPSLIVCPRKVNGVEVKVGRPRGRGWTAAQQKFNRGLGTEKRSSFAVHLDTLGTHGLSGWHGAEDFPDGVFDPERIESGDEEGAEAAAREAVARAAGECSILILPELAATPAVLAVLSAALRAERQAPALTIAGLYHLSADADEESYELVADEDLAGHLNEAVVLGPDGGELWRHRKLSCAEGKMEEDESRVIEDIRPGKRMEFVPTALGNLAVMICLDAIAPQSRERLVQGPANVLFVPSLSPTVRRHRDSIRHLVEVVWGVAFVCNRSPFAKLGRDAWHDPKARSFWGNQRQGIQIPADLEDPAARSFVFRLEAEPPAADTGDDDV